MIVDRNRDTSIPEATTSRPHGSNANSSMTIVIHHNPDCGTSRSAMAVIETAGYEQTVIEYLKTGWTQPQLLGLFAAADLTPRLALRPLVAALLVVTLPVLAHLLATFVIRMTGNPRLRS